MPEYIKNSATVTAENQFTSWLQPTTNSTNPAKGVIATWSGSGTATIVLQSKRAGDANPVWEETLSTAGRYNVEDGGGDIQYRVGVKTGGFTSGTFDVSVETWIG